MFSASGLITKTALQDAETSSVSASAKGPNGRRHSATEFCDKSALSRHGGSPGPLMGCACCTFSPLGMGSSHHGYAHAPCAATQAVRPSVHEHTETHSSNEGSRAYGWRSQFSWASSSLPLQARPWKVVGIETGIRILSDNYRNSCGA